MTVWKPKGRNVWKYEFQIDQRRYSGSTHSRSKKEALLVEANAKANALAEAHRPQRSVTMTLGDALTRYLSTIERQADHLGQVSRSKQLLDSLSSTASMEKITDVRIAECVERWAAVAADRTINNRLALLRRVHTVASKRWDVRTVAVDWTQHFRRVKGKPRPLSSSEVQRWLAEVQRVGGVDDFDFAVCLLDTGCRYSEAASLTWDRVDLTQGTVRVFRTKTQNESTIGLSDRLWAIMRRRHHECSDGYVFGGSVPRPHHASRLLRSTMDAVGINSPEMRARYGLRSLHSCRDTFATNVVQHVGLLGLRNLLGHSDVRMSQKYAAISDMTLVESTRAALSSTGADTRERPTLSLVHSVAALKEDTLEQDRSNHLRR